MEKYESMNLSYLIAIISKTLESWMKKNEQFLPKRCWVPFKIA